MDWLVSHVEDPDPTPEELAAGGTGGSTATPMDVSGEEEDFTADQATAQSLKCDDCGKLLRNPAAAEFHAVKSGHQNFSESTDAIAPLTEEEKKARLADIQARLVAKREQKRLAEIEENKSREKVRRTTGKEMTEIKEKQKEKEMQKAFLEKKREKEDDKRAKDKIRAQIEADKKDRARQAEERKLISKGLSTTQAGGPSASEPAAAQPAAPARSYNETRLQIRLPDGTAVTETFQADDSLEKVYAFLKSKSADNPPPVPYKLLQTFPRKLLDGPSERAKSLKELGLVPSAALVAQ
ncbi:hypothetical protein HKX48_008383 [Thoreauomyces humboldtii]|nr:hypothetical protein HKX48_008383 [Thoreauomyces humboldtii]